MLEIKKIIYKGIFIFFCTILSAALFLGIIINAIDRLISKSVFPVLNSECVVRTLGANFETVNASISFYQPDGLLLGSYERAWYGTQLNIECINFKTKNSFLVFPYRIFSDKNKNGTGVNLYGYYTKKSFPAIYDFPEIGQREKHYLKVMFYLLKTIPEFTILFSSAKYETVSINNFGYGFEYNLTMSPDNSVFIKSYNVE